MSLSCITAHISNHIVNICNISDLIFTLYFVNYQELVLVLALIREVQCCVLVLLHPAVAHRHIVTGLMSEGAQDTTQIVGQQADQQPG